MCSLLCLKIEIASKMPMSKFAIALSLQLLVVCSLLSYSSSAVTFTITNKCPYTVWPGTLAGAGTPQLPYTGFQLDSGQSVRIPSVPGWSGRIWARTGCTFNAAGVGTCQTGDCGGKLECLGMGATPPASLFEITLGAGDDLDFYDVSIVDGYNLPVVVFPQGVHGNCTATGCASNINMGCPRELQVVGYGIDNLGEPGSNVIGCKSACGAFGSDQYCCSGEFANPSTCKPSFYSGIFKRACPRAYSYAFDDGTSTFTCKGYDYTIVFCPANGMSTNTGSGGGGAQAAPPSIDTGSGGALTTPPSVDTGSGGALTTPPSVNTGSGGALTTPPSIDTGSSGALTTPPSVDTRIGGALTAPPSIDTGSVGALTTPPSIDTGSGGALTAPPSIDTGSRGSLTPPFVDIGSGGALTTPPFVDMGSGGALPAPPFVDTGSGSALTAPPFVDTGSGGALTAPPIVEEIRHGKPRKTISSSSPVPRWPFSVHSLILTVSILFISRCAL